MTENLIFLQTTYNVMDVIRISCVPFWLETDNFDRPQRTNVAETVKLTAVTYYGNVFAGTSINFAFSENSDIPFTMVVYEKIFGSINK